MPEPTLALWRSALTTFGRKLRGLRKDAHLTLEELAAQIGGSTSNLSTIERGEQALVPQEDLVVRYVDHCIELWEADRALKDERRAALLLEHQQLAQLGELVDRDVRGPSTESEGGEQVASMLVRQALALAEESGLGTLAADGSEIIPVAATIGTTELPASTWLWRVHPRSVPVSAFESLRLPRRDVMYLSRSELTALYEGLLRKVPFDPDERERVLGRGQLDGMMLSALRTTRPLVLATARGEPDLVGLWPPDGVHGIEWPSRFDTPNLTIMLLGNRCPPDALSPLADHSTDLDDADGNNWLQEVLSPYRVRISDSPAESC